MSHCGHIAFLLWTPCTLAQESGFRPDCTKNVVTVVNVFTFSRSKLAAKSNAAGHPLGGLVLQSPFSSIHNVGMLRFDGTARTGTLKSCRV